MVVIRSLDWIFSNKILLIKGSFGLFAILFVWEYIARSKKSNIKPSVGIAWTADKAKLGFYEIGKIISRLSSFLTYIKLGEIYDTLYDLIKPTCDLVLSPFEGFKGYWDTACTYKYPAAVTLGSTVLCTALGYCWYLYGHHFAHYSTWPFTYLPLKMKTL